MNIKMKHPAAFFLLALTAVMAASNIYTLIPVYDAIASDLEAGINAVSLGSSLFTCFYAAGLLILGSLSGTIGYRETLVFGLLLSAAATLGVSFAEEAWHLWVARSIQGFAISSFASVVFAYIFEVFPEKERTWLLILINTGFLAAGIIGQLLSALLENMYSWMSVFHFTAACYWLLFICMFFFLPRMPFHPEESRKQAVPSMFSLLKQPEMAKIYLMSMVPLFSVIAFYDSAARVFTGTEDELLIVRAVGLIGASFSLFTGILIRKNGAVKVLANGFAAGALFLFLMVPFQSRAGLVLLSIFFIASISTIIPSLITLIGSLAGKCRAKALSIYSFLLLSGASLAPAAASIFSFTETLGMLGCCFAASALLSLRILKTMQGVSSHF